MVLLHLLGVVHTFFQAELLLLQKIRIFCIIEKVDDINVRAEKSILQQRNPRRS